ncbi:hypothetical protein [Methanomassiliicoccus luminyensis]|uniref:hypothetical protein n=1 Tax=Methanomassiliicoccus luminyensis TaxID=1080712 RepID=UPI000474BAEB|nr:hypothetical protein [Methanomassiliicoccus luminyensis]
MALKELDDLRKQLQNDVENYGSSKEFWMALWKASPYAVLPLLSLSAIVAFYKDFLTNPWIIALPLGVTGFVAWFGWLGWKRTGGYATHISNIKTRLDEVEREIRRREVLMSEFFKTQDLEPDTEKFWGYNYPFVEQLPKPLVTMDTNYHFEGRVGPTNRRTGRYADVLSRYPDIIAALDDYKEKKKKYYGAPRGFRQTEEENKGSLIDLFEIVDKRLNGDLRKNGGHAELIIKGLLVLSWLGFEPGQIDDFAKSEGDKHSQLSGQQIEYMKRITDPSDALHVLNTPDIQMKAFEVDSKRNLVAEAGIEVRALVKDYFGPKNKNG